MLAKINALKTKHKELVIKLKEEMNFKNPDSIILQRIKKEKLHVKDTIMSLLRRRSILRDKRYMRRSRRLARFENLA